MSRHGAEEVRVIASARVGGRPDGAKIIGAAVIALLGEQARVRTIDRSPGSLSARRLLVRLASEARLVGALARSRRAGSTTVLYREVSCDAGMVFDTVIAGAAAVLGIPMVGHLHSWSTAERPSRWTRWAFAVGKATRLIVLSERMAAAAAVSLSLPPSQITVGPNRALTPIAIAPAALSDHNPSTRIGMLGNLLPGKGAEHFVALARTQPAGWSFALAGPAVDAASEQFVDQLNRLPSADYEGPLYGEDKSRFLASCNVIVFPSTYLHEAWPLVIEEALAHGCFVVASDVGLISEQLEDTGDGVTVPIEELTAEELTGRIRSAGAAGHLEPGARERRRLRWQERANKDKQDWLRIAQLITDSRAS